MRIFFNSLGIVFLSFLVFFLLKNAWWQAIVSLLAAAYLFGAGTKNIYG